MDEEKTYITNNPSFIEWYMKNKHKFKEVEKEGVENIKKAINNKKNARKI